MPDPQTEARKPGNAGARSIFISYSSSDKAIADQICSTLEAAGYPCWIAPRDIEPGADYATAIINGLHQARALVVIVSTASVASPHVLSEVEHAFDAKKPIIPFELSTAALPPSFDYFLSLSQRMDAHQGGTSENLARLSEAVSRALSGEVAMPRQKKRAPDKRVLAATAVLLLAVAAMAVWKWPSSRSEVKHPPDNSIAPPIATKTSPAAQKPEPWVNPKDGLTYVWIPPGTFMMGCSAGDSECKPDESPTHMVELPSGFWLGQTEVTNAAYHRIVTASAFKPDEANLPAVNISWSQAKSYCAAVDGRLPTEAEWEYAARGGTTTAYYGIPSKIAWYGSDSDGIRHPVGTRQPNAYGLYDMLGNASEWVLDRYYNKYDVEVPAIGNVDQPLAANASALARGGFWESEVQNIRASRRAEMEKDEPGPMVGIRCIAERK